MEETTKGERPTGRAGLPRDAAAALGAILGDEKLSDVYIAYLNERLAQSRRSRLFQYLATGVPLFAIALGLAGFLISDYIVDKAADRVENSIERKLEDEIQTMVAATVAGEIGKVHETIQREGVFQRLSVGALSLDLRQTISKTERDAVMEQLRAIDRHPDLTDRPEFIDILNKVTDAFSLVSYDDALVEIADLFPEKAAKSETFAKIVMRRIGEILIGSALPHDQWSAADLNRMTTFLRAVRAHELRDEALSRELLIEFVRAGEMRTAATVEMLRELDEMSIDQQASFFWDLIRYANPTDWRSPAKRMHLRMGEVTAGFVASHRDLLQPYLDDAELKAALHRDAADMRDRIPMLADLIDRVADNGV